MINQKRLKQIMNYCPQTGEFTWLETRRGVTRIGMRAGATYNNGYRVINVDKHRVSEHRLAFVYMLGRLPRGVVDHINGEKSDNSWANLREVTHSQNNMNQKLGVRNSTGVIGVRFRKQRNKWVAFISYQGKQKHIGHYNNFFDAVCARKSAEIEYGYYENHSRVA